MYTAQLSDNQRIRKEKERKIALPLCVAPYSGIATVTPALAEADKKASCLFVRGALSF